MPHYVPFADELQALQRVILILDLVKTARFYSSGMLASFI